MRKLLLALFALPLLCGLAFGQAQVQQSPTRLDACTAVATSVQAVSTQTAATVTVTGSNYAYICGIFMEVCGNGTGTAQTNVTFTSTGLQGNPSWAYSTTAAQVTSACFRISNSYGTPLKSATPGTNVVITPPAAATNNSYGIRIYYYLAP